MGRGSGAELDVSTTAQNSRSAAAEPAYDTRYAEDLVGSPMRNVYTGETFEVLRVDHSTAKATVQAGSSYQDQPTPTWEIDLLSLTDPDRYELS